MKRQNYLLKDYDQFKNLINTGELSADTKYLIIIHTAAHLSEDAGRLASDFAVMFPNSEIIGISTNNVIYCGKLYQNRCIVSFISTENTDIKTAVFCYDNLNSEQLADNVIRQLVSYDTKAMLNFFANYYSEISDYVNVIDNLCPDVKMIGGVADKLADSETERFVFTKDGVYKNALVAASFSGTKLTTASYSITGCKPVSDFHIVTKAHGSVLDEIDGIPAADWFRSTLGIKNFTISGALTNITDNILLRFPLLTDEYGAMLFVYYEESDDSIRLYFTNCREGMKFRISYQSALSNTEHSAKVSRKIAEVPCETMFVYSCAFREMLFDGCAKRELLPYAQSGVCGALLSGEIGPSEGHSAYLNGTCNLLAAAENDSDIRVDDTSIYSAEMLDKYDVVYNNLLRRYNESMYSENAGLMREIEQHEAVISKSVFNDSNTGRENLSKFVYDNRQKSFTKGCLVMLEKGDIAATKFSGAEIGSILNANMDVMQKYLSENYSALECRMYVYNDYSFIITTDKDISTELFIAAIQNLFIKYGTVDMPHLNYSCVNHFMTVAGEENMLDKLKLMKANSTKSLERFIVYDSAQGIEHAAEEAMKTVALINYAISNDTVIPYFQPIYDNVTGTIDKFEALMRIKGPDGRIYYPGQFLTAAKEYRLYLQMSKIMITKVFDLFADRKETVSINLSAYDINSPEIRGLIYENLERIGNAEHFVFEVLESEEFRDIEVLKKFIANVRKHNVRIAIDDFGSGFTNLLEIAQLSPNFIKIDGQIVREVVESEMHQKIVGTILHLAKSFNIDLIAEYIENEELQQYASEQGVRYSQGYYFSQAVPFEELENVVNAHESKVNV